MHSTISSTAAAASSLPQPSSSRGGRRAEPKLPFTIHANRAYGVLFELSVAKGLLVHCGFELAAAAALAKDLEQAAEQLEAMHADKRDSYGVFLLGGYGRLHGWSGCHFLGGTLTPPSVRLELSFTNFPHRPLQNSARSHVELELSLPQARETAARVRDAVLHSQAFLYELQEAQPQNAGKELDADPGDEHRAPLAPAQVAIPTETHIEPLLSEWPGEAAAVAEHHPELCQPAHSQPAAHLGNGGRQ